MRKTTKQGIEDLKNARNNFLRTMIGEIKKPFQWVIDKIKQFMAWFDI